MIVVIVVIIVIVVIVTRAQRCEGGVRVGENECELCSHTQGSPCAQQGMRCGAAEYAAHVPATESPHAACAVMFLFHASFVSSTRYTFRSRATPQCCAGRIHYEQTLTVNTVLVYHYSL